jgi:hypothetical protein
MSFNGFSEEATQVKCYVAAVEKVSNALLVITSLP